ncbi:hypothetical protein BX661DRAFT_181599 [Kickxella alabastrina]|uniref:uncharacterized protein n=1 Tax=Kickxella alabastrina TaxID=61397 RepID=UPI0022200599|nr:uncharacterized protein BX661DRAFT_181599 [Kickxella alabastrina]KAI7829232.1 hypothetical protein BX661DRAFT_181599 [Kickxella alabastrina]
MRYLKTNASTQSTKRPSFTLHVPEAITSNTTTNLSATLLSTIGSTPVLKNRRKQKQQNHYHHTTSTTNDSTAITPDVAEPHAWAIEKLRILSTTESPDFTQLSQIWQLPNPQLSNLLCFSGHLLTFLLQCSASSLAQFIKTIVVNPDISMENQQLLLRYVAEKSSMFSARNGNSNGNGNNEEEEEAIPAILQSQIIALVPIYSHVVVSGLLLPLTENPAGMPSSTTSMVVKIVKADMPHTATESFCRGIALWANDKQRPAESLGDNVFQVMETLLGTIPGDQPSISAWSKGWIEILQRAASAHAESKKLGAVILHFVNKFGSRMNNPDLDLIATAANILTTPLKRAIISTVARKLKKK